MRRPGGRLAELVALRDSGVLTDAEYELRRRQVEGER